LNAACGNAAFCLKRDALPGRGTSARFRLAVMLLAFGFAAPGFAGPTGEMEPELRALLEKAIKSSDSFEHRFDAEVWLTDMSGRLQRFIKDDGERLQFLRILHAEAQRARIPPELALAVIEVESRVDRLGLKSSRAPG
jgi:hypothetical protein